MKPEQRIDDLVTRLNEANAKYRLGEPSGMTDREFDAQLKELYSLEQQHPEFAREDSPTRRIGIEPLTGLTRVKHSVPMLSIENAYTYQEIEKFLDHTKATSYTLEHKVDGVALSVIYEDGRFVQALTRGDGIEGDDVTHNAKTIQGIPHGLDRDSTDSTFPPERYEIRGEVYMPNSAFQQWNVGGRYANPRNATAGAIRLLNPAECAKRPLRFIAHSAVTHDDIIVRQDQFLEMCRWYGFETATYPDLVGNQTCYDDQTLRKFFQTQYGTEEELKRIGDMDFETDGMVIKVNSFAQQREIGGTSVGPKWQIAYKIEKYEGQTILQGVDWPVGKTGVLTPVGRLAPVEIDGTTVSNVTIHNLDIIRSLGLRLNDTIIVKKAGKIIPAIDSVVSHSEDGSSQEIVPPETCPSCGEPVIIEKEADTGTVVRCINGQCPAQVAFRILFYTSRKAVDMSGLGEHVITWFVDEGRIEDFVDLYGLTIEDFLKAPRIGKTVAKKLVDAVQSRKTPPLDKFLIGLAISGVGEGTTKRLTKVYSTLDEIEIADCDDLAQIPDIGKVTAESIIYFFNSDHWAILKHKMNMFGVCPAEKAKAETLEFQPLAGQTIVVTGTLTHYKRDEIETVIEQHGGKTLDSVSKKTSFVLAGVKAGSKLAKAQSLGIPVIDEDEFVRRITGA